MSGRIVNDLPSPKGRVSVRLDQSSLRPLRRAARGLDELGAAGLVRAVATQVALRWMRSTYASKAETELRTALKGYQHPAVIIAGTHDWYYPYWQRAHHLAKALAAHGRATVYVSPSHGRDPELAARKIDAHLYMTPHLDAAVKATVKPFLYVSSTNTRNLLEVVRLAIEHGGHILYDYVDAIDPTISNGPITPQLQALHRELLANEQLATVVATADCLFSEIERARRSRLALVTNGVDVAHFSLPKSPKKPIGLLAELAGRDRPIVGYFGLLANWLDYGIVYQSARLRPQYDFVLIGPDFDGSIPERSELPENVHILPPVTYTDLPAHAALFDVAMIPFAINGITDATSPIKLFEYMALGKPIVSTPIPESRKYDCVVIASEPRGFAQAVDRALALGRDDAYRAKLDALAAQNSWHGKAAEVLSLITLPAGSAGTAQGMLHQPAAMDVMSAASTGVPAQ
jgi:teichuronic acid biosynthesis glycosyltransferase TuaH